MKALIIDDESKARSLLKTIISEYVFDIDEVMEATNLLEGVAVLQKNAVDIVFLDIEMPNHSGLELFSFLNPSEINFELVFTTAYSEYAIKAFEFSAIDYLLKPLRPNKVVEAVEKAKIKLEQNQLQERLFELKNALTTEKFNKIALPVEEGVLFVKLDDIYFLQAESMYTQFYLTNGKKILISKPLKYFTDMLENREMFYKSHRSYLVNLKYLQRIVKKDGTSIELENNALIPVSKDKKEELNKILEMLM